MLPGPALRQAILPDPDPTKYPQNNHLQETVLKPKKGTRKCDAFPGVGKSEDGYSTLQAQIYPITTAVLPWIMWFMLHHMAQGLPTHWSPDSNGQLFNPIWSHGQFKYVLPLICAINQHLHVLENTQYSMQHY